MNTSINEAIDTEHVFVIKVLFNGNNNNNKHNNTTDLHEKACLCSLGFIFIAVYFRQKLYAKSN